jgi:hypothetical protein
LKLGFVSRANFKDNYKHQILQVARHDPRSFAQVLSLSINNMWGTLKSIIGLFASESLFSVSSIPFLFFFSEKLLKEQDGKYLLVKDPSDVRPPLVRCRLRLFNLLFPSSGTYPYLQGTDRCFQQRNRTNRLFLHFIFYSSLLCGRCFITCFIDNDNDHHYVSMGLGNVMGCCAEKVKEPRSLSDQLSW